MSLQLEHVSFSYGNNIIFKDLSFTFPKSGLVVILGKSGCGKTTLLSLISSTLKPNSGEIKGNGRDEIALLFQSPLLLDYLNVSDNILFPLSLEGKKKNELKNKIKKVLSLVKLDGYENRDVKTLSGGEKTRVALARALIQERETIILDEPTGALDEKTSEEIYSILESLKKDHLLILVTHDEKNAYRIADDLYELESGQLTQKKMKAVENKNNSSLKVKPEKKNAISLKDSIHIQSRFLAKKKFRLLLSTVFLAFELLLVYSGLAVFKNIDSFSSQIMKEHYTYEAVRIKEKEVISSEGHMKLEKYLIPSEDTLNLLGIQETYISLSYFLPESNDVSINNKSDVISFYPSFNQDESKIEAGTIPTDKDEVVVNLSFIKQFGLDYTNTLNKHLTIHHKALIKVSDIESTDYLSFDYDFKIVGIVKEKTFFNKPIVYYNYQKILHYIENKAIENISKEIGVDETLEYLLDVKKYKEEDYLSHELIALVNNPQELEERGKEIFKDKILIESNPLSILKISKEMVTSLLKVVLVFLFLNLICSFLLELLSVSSLYEDNIRLFALIHVFSNNSKNRKSFVTSLSVIYFLLCSLFTTLFILLTTTVVDLVLKSNAYPLIFNGIDFVILSLLFLVILLVSSISASIPLKKIKDERLKKELEGED